MTDPAEGMIDAGYGYVDTAFILLENAGRTPRAQTEQDEIAIAQVRALRGIGYALLALREELRND